MRVFFLAALASFRVLAQSPAAQGLPTQSADPSRLASIEGRVVSGVNGQPLQRVTLTLRSLSTMSAGTGRGVSSAVGTSDSQGNFSFSGLEPGRYFLTPDRAGYVSVLKTVNTLIDLSPGQHLSSVTVRMSPLATISGKVTDERGAPVVRVNVRILLKGYGTRGSEWLPAGAVQTDESGSYRIPDLRPGRYILAFRPRRSLYLNGAHSPDARPSIPDMDYTAMYYPGVLDRPAAQAVNLMGGETRTLNLQMKKVPVHRISGKVDGSYPGGATPTSPVRMRLMVSPADDSSWETFLDLSGQAGTFDVGGLSPGKWLVSVLGPPGSHGETQYLNSTLVPIADSDIANLKISLRPPADLAGSITFVPGKTPMQGAAQVVLEAQDPGFGARRVSAQVGPNGAFTLSGVSAMRYGVAVTTNSPGYLKSATLGGRDVLIDGLDMRNGGGNLEIVYSMSAAEIDGMATTADGPAAANGIVTVVPDPPQPERPDLYRQGPTFAGGLFSIRGVPPGKYRVHVWEELEPGAQYDPDYMKPFESLGTSVSVGENGKAQLTLTQISAAQAADINRRAGR